jgi:hypothetical protein
MNFIPVKVSTLYIQSQTEKSGTMFFANVNLFTISMVTIKIFSYFLL